MSWSALHPCCTQCKGTASPHKGSGLCRRCYNARFRKEGPKNGIGRWSRSYDHCVRCGGNEAKHQCRGLCRRCFDNLKNRDPERIKQKSVRVQPPVTSKPVTRPMVAIPLLGQARILKVYEEFGERVADFQMVHSRKILKGLSLDGVAA